MLTGVTINAEGHVIPNTSLALNEAGTHFVESF